MKILIVGGGCDRCRVTEAHARQAVADLRIEADISHCYDLKEFPRLGVRLTPALLVDGKIVVSGRVPGVDEIKGLLTKP